MQLALRRHGGDVRLVRRSVGRALMLCGGTAIAGFGSLAWSGNAGMASLGKVCAVGIGSNMLISVFLLPAWWRRACAGPDTTSRKLASAVATPISPSSFYQVGLWRFGLAVVRVLPAWLVNGCCVLVAELHFRLQRPRREVVVQNLLPGVSGDRVLAERTARRLYRNFALKLADLWRVESGMPVGNWLTRNEEQEVIRSAWTRGRGVLFITLHLGNWEHGGLLLTDMGIKLTVLTLPEPEDRLTDLRSASRARWGIETLIVGRDQFAFVEVIKRLQDGGALAISIDRPPERSSAVVELFGQPFRASIAAAELARASGCALIGVTVVRQREGYAVRALPEFMYDRRALGSHEARCELTQQILRAFEPGIREHLDQWYHFVPIWPEGQLPSR
jgi:KDO2-lipid IV(A) lauroyltransferase